MLQSIYTDTEDRIMGFWVLLDVYFFQGKTEKAKFSVLGEVQIQPFVKAREDNESSLVLSISEAGDVLGFDYKSVYEQLSKRWIECDIEVDMDRHCSDLSLEDAVRMAKTAFVDAGFEITNYKGTQQGLNSFGN